MSLIHEALKKVERERSLGEPPSLDSPRFRPRRRRRRWPWLLLLLVAFFVAGVWHWRAPLVHKARAIAHRALSSEQPASAATAAASRVADAGDASNRVSASATATAATRAASPPAAPVRSKQAQPAPTPPTPAAQASAGSGVAQKPPTVVTPAAAPPKSPRRAANGPPLYWELPYAQRQDIPDMSISMHLYTANPAERFVIINGERHVEGDTLADGLKLLSIDPDGITVDKGGEHFRVPRQGMR